MRGFRRSLIGFIILALVGGYYYFYEIRYRGRREKKKELSEKIFPVKKDDVTKIIYQKGKSKITLEHQGNVWKIVTPIRARADEKVVSSLLKTLPELKSFRKLSDVKWDNPIFGFTKNSAKITLFDKKGNRYFATFGGKNPTNSYFYTLKGKSKTILLVWVYPDKLLNEGVYNFRFKKILPLSSDIVEGIHFKKDNLDITLQREKGHKWRILKPITAKGDRYAIEGFISTATEEKVIRFLDHPPKKPEMFGWDHPRMMITFNWHSTQKTQEGKGRKYIKTATILIGKNRDASHVYVKIASKPTIMIVKNDYVKELDKKLFDFRDKNVWNFEIDNVTSVRYENPDAHLIIEAKKIPKKDEWEIIQPIKTLADTTSVEDWLWDLTGFRIKQFLTESELSELTRGTLPSYKRLFVITTKKSGTPLKLKLYHIGDKWIAHTTETPNWYDVLNPKDVPKTFKTVFELRYRKLLKFNDTDVTKLVITKGKKPFIYKKKRNLWYHLIKNKERKVPNIDVLNFLWELSDLKYTKLLDELPEKNIFSEAVQVALFKKGELPLGHLSFALDPTGKGIYFKVQGKNKIYFIDKQGTKKFENAYHKLINPEKKE